MLVGDRKALKNIDNTISTLDRHYQVGLPWSQEDHYLPFNKILAESRLQALKRQFNRIPGLEKKITICHRRLRCQGIRRTAQ